MEDYLSALDAAFAQYRQDLDAFQKKSRPTDGLLGFGRSLRDDICHERLDERIAGIVEEMSRNMPSEEDAEAAVRKLLIHEAQNWPLAAEWMLRAVERHALPLIPFLKAETAGMLSREYAGIYKPWDRLPVQKEVYKALKARA